MWKEEVYNIQPEHLGEHYFSISSDQLQFCDQSSHVAKSYSRAMGTYIRAYVEHFTYPTCTQYHHMQHAHFSENNHDMMHMSGHTLY